MFKQETEALPYNLFDDIKKQIKNEIHSLQNNQP